MPTDPQYVCDSEGTIATGATIKTVVGAKAHANSGLLLTGFVISFDGVTASAVPVLCELSYCTWATNSPGTASTSTTPRQIQGRVLTAGFTAGRNWTTQPTVLTPIFPAFTLTPNGGTLIYDFPLGEEPDCAFGEGFALTVTAAATVGFRGGITVSRI